MLKGRAKSGNVADAYAESLFARRGRDWLAVFQWGKGAGLQFRRDCRPCIAAIARAAWLSTLRETTLFWLGGLLLTRNHPLNIASLPAGPDFQAIVGVLSHELPPRHTGSGRTGQN